MLLGTAGSTISAYAETMGEFKNPLGTIQRKGYSSEKFTSKPLVILINFQDYKYTELDTREDLRINTFTGSETTAEFYEQLFFGDNTYKISDGKEHITVNKFFMEESGGTYEFKGKVVGWYTADHNAAEYGSNEGGSDQPRARNLVKEAIEKASKDLDLSEFDIEDKWDLDGDGNYNEPDGIIDSLVVIHPGLGEGRPRGSLGADAIGSFRWGFNIYGQDMTKLSVERRQNLVSKNPTVTDKNNKPFAIEDFAVLPQDLPIDVFNHEFGHVLGLPDLYDYFSYPPLENWSLMGACNTGDPRGSQPVSYGAYCKEFLQKDFEARGRVANWQNSKILNLEDIDEKGIDIVLDQATLKGQNNDAIKIKLPEARGNQIVTPPEGKKCYFSGKGNYLENYMTLKESIDLTNTTSPKLNFKTWYAIDPYFDFGSVQVKEAGTDEWLTIQDETGLTTDKVHQWVIEYSPETIKDRNPGWGFTDSSNEWLDATFDLSQFKGKKVDFRFRFRSDYYNYNTPEEGIYFDDIKIVDNSNIIFSDNAEGESKFNLNGFKQSDGVEVYDHYYLLEWRNSGAGTLVDQGLQTIDIEIPELKYDPGLVIWYVNGKYGDFNPDQNTNNHRGELSVGVVDADQNPVTFQSADGIGGADRMNYQMHDAAFSLRPGSDFEIKGSYSDYTIKDNNTFMNPIFNDSNDYTANYWGDPSGLILKNYGLKVFVTDESKDRSTTKIHIAREIDGSQYTLQENDLIKAIKVENDKLYITSDDEYSEKAYVEYVGKDNAKQQLVLNYKDDKYVGDAEFLAEDNEWKISHVIFIDKAGNAKAIYNKEVQKIYGADFASIWEEPVKPDPEEPNKEDPNKEEPEKSNSEEPEKSNPEEPAKPSKENPNKKLPQTGAMVGSGLILLSGITLAGVGAITLRKRNQKK